MKSHFLVALALCIPFFSLTGQNLIVNGDFETGTLSGWTVVEEINSNGTWIPYSGTTLPISGNTFYAPPQGTYAAAFDERGPSSSVMYQDVTIPAGYSATLQFTYYYHDYAGIYSPDTLSFMVPYHNQQYRIDLMTSTSDPFSVAPSDVLQNLVQLNPSDPVTLAPTTVSFDVSQFAGQTVRVRFAAVDNVFLLNAGVDAVSLIVTGVPSPQKVKGVVLKNQFLTLAALVNQITWMPPSNFKLIEGYNIYRNGKFIAFVPSVNPLIYNDPSQIGAGPTTYGVTTVTLTGESSPVTVTIPKG